MPSASVEDRLAIRELIDTYNVGAMRLDMDIVGTVWADDAAWHLPSLGEPITGKANILKALAEKMDYVKFIGLIGTPFKLEVNGDRATCETYNQETIVPKTGGLKFAVGCFHDELVKRDGRWLFLSRRFELLGVHL